MAVYWTFVFQQPLTMIEERVEDVIWVEEAIEEVRGKKRKGLRLTLVDQSTKFYPSDFWLCEKRIPHSV